MIGLAEIVLALILGILGLYGLGTAGNRNRKPGGKRPPARNGQQR